MDKWINRLMDLRITVNQVKLPQGYATIIQQSTNPLIQKVFYA